MSRNEARISTWAWSEYLSGAYDLNVTMQAWRIQDSHGFGWWDCMLLASAWLAGCTLFLCEDMQHRRTIGSLTILNPLLLDRDFFLPK
jgi:predicted nucleic acid-binding protein